jgi:HK97 family phage major capsid protein
MNESIKQYLVETFGADPAASDAEWSALLADKLATGAISASKLAALVAAQAEAPASAKAKLESLVKSQINDALAPFASAIEKLAGAVAAGQAEMADSASDRVAADSVATKSASPPAAPSLDEQATALADLIEKGVVAVLEKRSEASAQERAGDAGPNVVQLFGAAGAPRVKNAAERYAHVKSAVEVPAFNEQTGRPTNHPQAGQRLHWNGRAIEAPSQRDKACVGAWLRHTIGRQIAGKGLPVPLGFQMTEEDHQLLAFALHEMAWTGAVQKNGAEQEIAEERLGERFVKAPLLDDGVSNGLEIAPIVFDDAIITTPLLYGELFPLVETVTLARGRRVEGALMSNASFGASTEGSAATLFDFSNFIAALDTTIYPASCFMEVGLDFVEDSPVAVAERLTSNLGDAALVYLDKVIAVGDGTSQPTGLTVASGLTTLLSANGVGGPPTLGDIEGLHRAVPKATRASKGAKNVFVSNDATYHRIRSMPNGPNDARRLFGLNHSEYKTLEYLHKIQNDLTDSQILCGNLGYYRMYRRRGVGIRVETGGITLARANTMLIAARMRIGGKPMLASAFAKMTDFPNFG